MSKPCFGCKEYDCFCRNCEITNEYQYTEQIIEQGDTSETVRLNVNKKFADLTSMIKRLEDRIEFLEKNKGK